MATPQLTTGGRAYAPPPQPNADDPRILLDRWDATLTRMLSLALEYGKLDALASKRRAWVDANPFHDLYDERHTAMWHTRMERNELGGKLMDFAAELSRLQARMPPSMLNGLAALMGHPLWPFVGQRWALVAARMQTVDIFIVASEVLMDLRAEEEGGMA